MFCSNQQFSISGDKIDIKSLKSSISAIIEGFEFKPRFYRIEETCLCFYQYTPDNTEGVIEISKEDLTTEYYLSIIQLYFSSHKYKEALNHKTFNEFANADGSSYAGWQIKVDNKGFGHKLMITPFWCFYHK